MTTPQYYEFFNPVLQAIRELGGSASIRELNETAIKLMSLSPQDLAEAHGDRGTEVEYRLAWARSYLKTYGLLNNSERGIWVLTSRGREIQSVDPDAVKRFVRDQYRSKRKEAQPAPAELDPAEAAEAEAVLTQSWEEQLLETLQTLPPSTFERLCQRLLRESGFVKVEVTGRTGDGGIDGVGIVRIGGLLGFPILFQCKRYRGSVGPSTIRDFRGAMIGRADRGLVITTGTFSRDARAEATRDGAPPIDLLDGEELVEKLKELRLGVNVQMIEDISVDASWFETV